MSIWDEKVWYFIILDRNSMITFQFQSFQVHLPRPVKKKKKKVDLTCLARSVSLSCCHLNQKNSGWCSCSWWGSGMFGKMITVCSWREVTEACSSTLGVWTLSKEICYDSISLSVKFQTAESRWLVQFNGWNSDKGWSDCVLSILEHFCYQSGWKQHTFGVFGCRCLIQGFS